MLTEKVMTNIGERNKLNNAKYATVRLEDCGTIGRSEKKVVRFSSLSHILLFLGFACDSGGKKWINLRKLGLCLAALRGISQVHFSQARTKHDTKSGNTLFSPSSFWLSFLRHN